MADARPFAQDLALTPEEDEWTSTLRNRLEANMVKRGIPRADAEDLAADVFLVLCEKYRYSIGTLDGLKLAFTILHNKQLSYWKSRSRDIRASLLNDQDDDPVGSLPATGAPSDDIAIWRQNVEMLVAAMLKLKEPCQQVFAAEIDAEAPRKGFPHIPHLAKLPPGKVPSNVNPATWRTWKHRCLKALREYMREHHPSFHPLFPYRGEP